MPNPSNSSERPGPDDSAITAAWLIVGVIYLTLFWGRVVCYLPQPFDRWGQLARPTLAAWLRDSPWLWLVAHIVIGVVIPGVVLAAFHRKLTDVGLGPPNVLGRRMTLVGALLSIPFGLWLMRVYPSLALRSLGTHDICSLLVMIPEHFLICGVYVALFLPGRRLSKTIPQAPIEGKATLRALCWLGLAQPPTSETADPVVAWFGLTRRSLLAVVVSGALFCLVHVGKETLEAALSFPGGVAVAYVTLRSRSIWPAIIAHWAMNLIPLALLAAFGWTTVPVQPG